MAAMDEFRAEREAVKHGPLKERLAYFWDYHKWHVIIIAAVVIFLIYSIYTTVTKPETLLSGMILNTHNQEAYQAGQDITTDFLKGQNIDTKKNTIDLNTSLSYSTDSKDAASSNYTTLQVITAQASAGVLDFVLADLDTMTDLAYRNMFADLTTVLTEEQMTEYAPYFLYIDRDIFLQRDEAFNETGDASSIVLSVCETPDGMKDPIPVFLDISQCEKMTSLYLETPDTLVIGVTQKTEHQEMMTKFLDYLME